ncbi:hypothetical protein E0H75_02040 [Kribbella capetownensis]|uniref:Uncharacterized protein n=1 Tax=Kribbella capetownensis TaxID=1572659 RepID=A0A4R0K3Y0_9ACTN|nr:hypothetical protein [Kribbella capetownensis]TCC52566.1 hypothetical protein E0H75_02040 [Kribbella capetownensis]
MRLSRRAFGTLAGGAVLGLLTACAKTPEEAAADRLEWLRGLDGVEKAEVVAAGNDELIVLTLAKRLPDQAVATLVDEVKRGFDRYDDDYYNSIELAIDDFRARFSPPRRAVRDSDLERVLWLRKDGRATASTYGSSGPIVTAPASAVAAVAVGFDQAAQSDDGRRTHRVESVDRQVVVEWTDSPGLGFRLDRVATQQFADLQAKYPGLTGWIQAPDRLAGIYFAAADIELDALLTGLPKLVTTEQFKKLELGWGPVRAPHTLFTKAFTPQVRALIGPLVKIPGVTRIDLRDDDGVAKPETVTVKDRAGYVATIASLRSVWDSYLSVQLIRRSSRYVGHLGRPVFRGSLFDAGAEYRIHAAVADLAGVTEVQVGPESANLTIARDITDAELATTLKAMAELPVANPIDLAVSDDPETFDITLIGHVTAGKYVAPSPAPAKVDPALITRVTTAWIRAAR